MNYESLQLVNYDGESIPSGYLFGDISAQWAITYLKSIGASSSAVDKIKEVEINKILYGIELLKSSDDGLGSTHVAMHEGKVYGGGNPMIPAAADEIKRKLRGEELAEGWVVETVQEYQQQAGQQSAQAAPQPVAQAVQPKQVKPVKPLERTKEKTIESMDTCALEYNSDNFSVSVDFTGQTPNIGKNLMYALKHYDLSEAAKLEQGFLKNRSNVVVDVSGIPESIRDEVMSMVNNPDNMFTDIALRLKTLDQSASMLEDFTPETSEKLGLSNTPDIFELVKDMNFVKLYNSGEISTTLIKSVFPTMYNAFKQVMDESGKIPDDFELSVEMLQVSDTLDKNDLLKSMSQMASAISSSVKGIGLLSKYANLVKGKKVKVRVVQASYIAFPLANIIATHSSEDSVTRLQAILNDDSPETAEELSRFISVVSTALADRKNPQDPLAAYKDRTNKAAETVYSKLDRRQVAVYHSELMAKLMVALATEQMRPDSEVFSSFGATLKTGGLRNPGEMSKIIASFNTDSTDGGNLTEQERGRSTRILQAVAILSFTNLAHYARGSSFVNGLKSFNKAHEFLSEYTDEIIDPVDFYPFVKVSPLTSNRDGTSLSYVDSSGEVFSLDTTTSSESEKREFAERAFSGVSAMIEKGSISSSTSNVAMLLLPDEDFPGEDFSKLISGEKPESEAYLYSKEGTDMQIMGAEVIQSFFRSVIDPITGGIKVNTGIGGSSVAKNAAFRSLLSKNPELVSLALGGFNSIEEKNALELKIREGCVGLMEAENSPVSPKTVNNIVNSLLGITQYEATMKILSSPENVQALLAGQTPVAPEGISEFTLSQIMPSISKFRSLNFSEKFAGHTDGSKKAQVIDDYIVGVISASAKAEADKKDRDRNLATNKPSLTNLVRVTSATQPAESFEALSMVGRLASELLDYKNDEIETDSAGKSIIKFTPKEDAVKKSERPIEITADSMIENSMKITFKGGRSLAVGLRKSTEKGAYIDALSLKTDIVNGERSLTIGISELKTVVNEPRNAHMNATRNPARNIRNMIKTEGFKKVKVQSTQNASVVFGNPEATEIYPASWSMHLDETSDLNVDGNTGTGFDNRGNK